MREILTETIIDAFKMLPFLFGAYLVLEYVEHRAADKLAHTLANARFGAVGGALLGCVPQCGGKPLRGRADLGRHAAGRFSLHFR